MAEIQYLDLPGIFAAGSQITANQQRNKLLDLQMQEATRKTEGQNRLRDLIATLPQDQQIYATMAPDEFAKARVKQMFPDAKDRYHVSDGVVFDLQGDGGPKVALQGPRKPPEGMQYNDAGQLVAIPGYVAMRSQIAAAGRAVNNVNIKQEGEEAKTVGKAYGDMFVDTQKGGLEAQRNIANIDRLSNMLEQVNTGRGAATTLELKRIAKSAGIDLEKYGIRDDVAPAEAAQALSREMALLLRNPAGGAGMPGAMSDADREYLNSMVPGIETTPEGRRLMMETMRRTSRRTIEVAKMARDYRAKNGAINEGFYEDLAKFSEANPLFRDLVQNTPDPTKWQKVDIPVDLQAPPHLPSSAATQRAAPSTALRPNADGSFTYTPRK